MPSKNRAKGKTRSRDRRPPHPGAPPGPKAERPVREELVRAAVLEAYGAIRSEGHLADRTLERILRREARLFSSERRAVSEAVYGMLRSERRLDSALFDGAPTLAGAALTTARYAAWRVLTGADPAEIARAQGLDGVIARRLLRVREPIPDKLPILKRVALEGSFPDALAKLLLGELGEQGALDFARSMAERAPLTVRTNALATTREDLVAALADEGVAATPTRYSPFGLVLGTRVNVFSLEAFKKGLFEVQDEGSQLLALLVGARAKERVLDACAGAGGKTLALAAEMHNRGELFASDIGPERLEELQKRTRRAGVHNVRLLVLPEAGAEADAKVAPLAGKLDRVLIDAPCTGLGTLRRNPDARYRFDLAEIARFPPLQAELLGRFAQLVRPGGRVVYATCSIARAENEDVVERFLARAPAFRRVPVEELAPDLAPLARGGYLRPMPHLHGMDGFFAAVLERSAT